MNTTVIYTHKGWFGLCPVYLAGIDSDGPNVDPRHWSLGWLMDLSEAVLSRAVLENAVLTGANLPGTKLDGASLLDADFTGANLAGATLANARIDGARFTDAKLDSTTWSDRRRCQPASVGECR